MCDSSGSTRILGLPPLLVAGVISLGVHLLLVAGFAGVLTQPPDRLAPEMTIARGQPIKVHIVRRPTTELTFDAPAPPPVDLEAATNTTRFTPTTVQADPSKLDAPTVSDARSAPVVATVHPQESVASAPIVIETPTEELIEVASAEPVTVNTSQGVETGAETLHVADPVYPSRSIRRGEQGTVLVAIQVSRTGKPGDAAIRESSGYTRLDEAALKAARLCEFRPALRDGIAIASVALVPFEFRLR